MKIAFINGSPKYKNSASGALINDLIAALQCKEENQVVLELHKPQITQEQNELLYGCDAIVFAFPLYVDGIPSHLLDCMNGMQEYFNQRENKPILVYSIVNCGFYEGNQNALAIEMVKNWTKKSGLIWGQGIGVGAGGMALSVTNVPLGKGPKRNLGIAFNKLAENITNRTSQEDLYISMNIPRFLYRFAAQLGWNMQIKSNGLKVKDLNRQL